ncbi:hypothetical protein [Roseibacillus ishigakijimensis]|uniref:Uncharacterized protein n=1 Tax=Roseibacillus ishigakijimensis TaxID=454146 RepID=A0A934VK81_9BACT|nr:hypothetical protein [Roseibacillus ishigakijimensis]MBK1833374.1 hypothetical protein [Roseibacillus ishigakijimensis]
MKQHPLLSLPAVAILSTLVFASCSTMSDPEADEASPATVMVSPEPAVAPETLPAPSTPAGTTKSTTTTYER